MLLSVKLAGTGPLQSLRSKIEKAGASYSALANLLLIRQVWGLGSTLMMIIFCLKILSFL